jgi:two-component system, response regulator
MILLVEDNPDDVKLTLRAFKQQRISNEVVVARDGEEALDFLYGTREFAGRDLSVMPSIILLDINLPKISGLDVLKHIRSQASTAYIPVIMLTTSNEDTDVLESYRSGVNSYIRKPVDYDSFSQAISQLGIYWLLLNTTPKP